MTLSSEEADRLFQDLNEMMRIVRQLDSIPLPETVTPVIHGNPYPAEIRCELREDIWIPFGSPEDIITQAPASRDAFIISPDIPHQRIG